MAMGKDRWSCPHQEAGFPGSGGVMGGGAPAGRTEKVSEEAGVIGRGRWEDPCNRLLQGWGGRD